MIIYLRNSKLKQEDALSSMIFNIELEVVIRGLCDTDVGIRLLNKNINSLAYADDIVLIGKIENEIKTLAELLRQKQIHETNRK